MVFYRKYRPQKIDDLDNETVRKALQAIFGIKRSPATSGSTPTAPSISFSAPHAFLFTGPKGLGKTSSARIVAKVVNCTTLEKEREKELEPCNTCDQCISITNGTNMDVFEIDAASNRGIDEIRDLKEKIRLAPLSSKKKVYIIDEVHMLTTEAFNALLKTLEEPPPHAMFILCTTEQHKLPATIISRCMHIQFTPATEEELVRSFKRIVAGESISITDEALKHIAGLSDRGFRDGAKILEEISLLSDGKEITKELIAEKYKTSNIMPLVLTMFDSLEGKDVKGCLEIVEKVVNQGIDIKYFLQELMQVLHDMMLFSFGIRSSEVKNRKLKLEIDEMKYLFELLSKAYQEMKYAVLPQLPLELVIIEYTTKKIVIPSGAAAKSRNLTQQSNSDGVDPSTHIRSIGMTTKQEGVTVSSLRKQVGDIKKNNALYGEPKKEKPEKQEIGQSTVELMHVSKDDITPEWLSYFWKNIISEMKQYNHTIAGVLRSCGISSYDQKTLVIQTKFSFHKERLDEIKTQEALAKVAKLLTGKDVAVRVELIPVTSH